MDDVKKETFRMSSFFENLDPMDFWGKSRSRVSEAASTLAASKAKKEKGEDSGSTNSSGDRNVGKSSGAGNTGSTQTETKGATEKDAIASSVGAANTPKEDENGSTTTSPDAGSGGV